MSTSSSENEAFIGKVVNNFEIQEVIGQGGMGIVLRAFHPELQSNAAVKIMRPELARQAGFYERFKKPASPPASNIRILPSFSISGAL